MKPSMCLPALVLLCACTQGGQERLTSPDASTGPPAEGEWTPPPKEVLDTDDPTVIVGRLWARPNPIAFPPPETGHGGILDFVVESLGGESVTIDDITIEGSVDFHADLVDETGVIPLTFDEWSCCPEEGCGGGGLAGSCMEYHPSGTEPRDVYLVVHTSDPTSPTFRVPIIIDHEGRYTATTPPPSVFDYVAQVWLRPNPIRLDVLPAGTSTTLELCLDHRGEPRITGIRTIGPGLSITGARDFYGAPMSYPLSRGSGPPAYLDLRYDSTDGAAMDGTLTISFLNEFDDEFTFGVPVIIR